LAENLCMAGSQCSEVLSPEGLSCFIFERLHLWDPSLGRASSFRMTIVGMKLQSQRTLEWVYAQGCF